MRVPIASAVIAVSAIAMPTAQAQIPDKLVHRIDAAHEILHELMSTPDKGIPLDIAASAQCVIVVPSFKKGAFVFGGENQPAAVAFRIKLGVHLEMPKRAVLELALLGEPAIFLPFAEPFVPLQSHGTGLGGCGAPRAAIGVEPIRHLIGRCAGHFVEPRGIGQERPDRLRRQREMRFLAVAIDRCHAQDSVAAGAASLSQIRQMSSMVSPSREAVNLPCSLEPFAENFQTNINSP